jgi:hypothetical protein
MSERDPFFHAIIGPDCVPFEAYAPPAFPIRRKTGLSRLQPRKFAAGETRRRSEADSKSGPLATVPLDLAEGRRLPRPGLAQAGEAGRRLGISL